MEDEEDYDEEDDYTTINCPKCNLSIDVSNEIIILGIEIQCKGCGEVLEF